MNGTVVKVAIRATLTRSLPTPEKGVTTNPIASSRMLRPAEEVDRPEDAAECGRRSSPAAEEQQDDALANSRTDTAVQTVVATTCAA